MKYRVTVELRGQGRRRRRQTSVLARDADTAARQALARFRYAAQRAVVAVEPDALPAAPTQNT